MDDRSSDLLGLSDRFTNDIGCRSDRVAGIAGLRVFWFS
jgi:hypothetical protein